MHPPFTVHLQKIPSGYRGTLATVGHIVDLIRRGAKNFEVRQTAVGILLQRGIRPKDYLGEIKALFEWVQQNIRYTRDTYRVEVLHSARRMLELRAGDCDDMAIVLGAMLEAVGHPVRLVITGPDPLRQDLFSHIYLEVFHKGRWIPLDATMPYPMGWAPRSAVKKTIAIERRPDMMADDLEQQGIGDSAAVPEWLTGLMRSVQHEAIQPRDPRVKALWDLLKQRQVLRNSPWLIAVLRRIWNRGLSVRRRPRTASRIAGELRLWGILPAVTPLRLRAAPLQPLRPVVLTPVGSVRPAPMQTTWPVSAQPSGKMVRK